jgi:hypothetical protein
VLASTYSKLSEFGDLFRRNLTKVVGDQLASPASHDAVERAAKVAMTEASDSIRSYAKQLATKYERVRGSMEPGLPRTRAMENVVMEMRSAVVLLTPLLPKLTTSNSVGERLLALAILQAAPQADQISWVGTRIVEEEQPFVQYHAAVALRVLAQAFVKSNRRELETTLQNVMKVLPKLKVDSDRYRTVQDIATFLEKGTP